MKKVLFLVLSLTSFGGSCFFAEEEMYKGSLRYEHVGKYNEASFKSLTLEEGEVGISKNVLAKLANKWTKQGWLKLDIHDGKRFLVKVKSDIFETQKIWGSKTIGYLFELSNWLASYVPGLRGYLKKGPYRRFPYFVRFLRAYKFPDDCTVHVYCSNTTIDDDQALALLSLGCIYELGLDECNNLTKKFARNIPVNTNLKSLIISCHNFDGDDIRWMIKSIKPEKLDLSYLTTDEFLVSDPLVSSPTGLKELGNLKEIKLSFSLNKDVYGNYLYGLPDSLEKLFLISARGLRIGEKAFLKPGEDLYDREESRTFLKLNTFSAEYCSNLEAKAFLNCKFPRLKHFVWTRCGKFSNEDVIKFLKMRWIKPRVKISTTDENIKMSGNSIVKIVGKGFFNPEEAVEKILFEVEQ